MDANEAQVVQGILGNLTTGNFRHARSELLRLRRDEKYSDIRGTIDKMLAIASRHSWAVLFTSIPVIVLLSLAVAAVMAPLQILVTRGAPNNEGDALSQFGWILAVVFSGCVYKGVRFARKRHPSLVKPAVSWILMIPVVLVLPSFLLVIYDVAIVVSSFVIGKYPLGLQALKLTLVKYWGTDSLIGAAFMANARHPLLWLSLVVTGMLCYYGPVGKRTSKAIEFINEAMEP
jgi:hypothetical protein